MSICDNCIHDEVCGSDGHCDESLIFCADMIPKRGNRMTREEALKILKEPDRIGYNVIHANDEETTMYNIKSQMALEMAIQALEKEPKFIAKSDGTIEQIKNCDDCLYKKEWEKIGKLISVVLEKQTEQEPMAYEEKIKQPSDDTRPYYANEWTPQDSLYVEQGMLYD